jgi:2-polyprenyl-6-methoxyphenol hydroxylase-like FAD-dependent oxidoreductase
MVRDARADLSLLGKPISEDELYLYADMSVDASAARTFDHTTPLLPLFGGIAGPLRPALERASEAVVHCAELVRLHLDSWCRHRVVLIGYAAHAAPQSMIEGACLAMEDRLVVAGEFSAMPSIELALASYQAKQEPCGSPVAGSIDGLLPPQTPAVTRRFRVLSG